MQRLLRPGWVHAGAWTLATGAAVTLSWFGVHTVLAGTAYDPPRALPVHDMPSPRADPQSSSTHRPKPPSPTPTPTPTREQPRKPAGDEKKDRTHEAAPPPSRSPSPSRTPPSSGSVRGATVPGGRAVFDLGSSSASLVSATPDEGWNMRIWNTPDWIRVTFTNGDTQSSVFCRWDASQPRIETFTG
ncbi:hypothetical protein [Streptomyces sp. NRRL S-1868]|uniref:hypothetical protein n=1 Tax=Streptomyces sp. NRRL S-1868 TaxID=1463892 RepID=UPI0004C9D544|nr:hypothetical protein [Streptomyces sp. NRRL S-1868]